MATTRLIPLHTREKRSIRATIHDIIAYVENPEKTDRGQLISSYQCDSRIADMEFLFMKKLYQQKTGRVRGKDDVIAYHLRQSFIPGEITPEEANRLGRELALRFTKGKNAFIVCTHIDKHHVHNHVIFSAVTTDHDRKFRNFWGSAKALRRLNDTLCIENGYSIIENPKRHGQSYNKWLGEQAGLPHREQIRLAIDDALAQKPESFDALLDLLRQAGYEVKGTANPSLKGSSQKRFLRMDTLGGGYTPEALCAVLAGKRTHTPRQRNQKKTEPPWRTNQLLIDIQAKLAQGKGTGYANWAKKFNLKQMAQTVAYLQEHGLMDYAVLSEKAAAAAGSYHALSDEIKAAEQRMTEIAVMEKQIINYARTREVYVAYRKAGYSKKYLAAHEIDIAIHKAAKQYFDVQGLKKLPTLKSLKAEYAELTAKKKTAYADYRQSREEMKELLTAKANVDRILGAESSAPEKRKEKQTDAR